MALLFSPAILLGIHGGRGTHGSVHAPRILLLVHCTGRGHHSTNRKSSGDGGVDMTCRMWGEGHYEMDYSDSPNCLLVSVC